MLGKKLGILILFLFSCSANAYIDMSKVGYNPNPDYISEKLGMGLTDDYIGLDGAPLATIKYFCDTKPDGTSNADGDTLGNGTIATPYYSLEKLKSFIASSEAGSVLALCRGGKFYATADIANQVPVKTNRFYPLHIRDYTLPAGSKVAPKIIIGPSGYAFHLIDSGSHIPSNGIEAEEGIYFQNLEFTSYSSSATAIWVVYDTDFGTVENCFFNGTKLVINAPGSVATERRAREEVTDLVFTHNTNTTGEIRDTITRTGGVVLWPTSTNSGDDIIVEGTVSNNGHFRVDSVSADYKTIYLTKVVTDQIPGRAAVHETYWDVVNETAPTTGVFVTHNMSNLYSEGWIIRNNRFENIPGGTFMSFTGGKMYNNEFINNGFARAIRDHHIYVNDVAPTANGYIFNNYLYKNAHFKGVDPNGAGTFAGGKCTAAQIVGHGEMAGFEIFDNYLTEDSDKIDNNCWGISFNGGYPGVPEAIHNLHIHDNIIHNAGTLSIGCSECIDAIIENNIIYSDKTTSAAYGIIVPDDSYYESGDAKTKNVTIRNNRIEGIPGTVATTNPSSIAIWAKPTDNDSEGFIHIENNVIKNWYRGIYNTGSGATTVTITGNDTSVGVTTNLQP